MATWPDREVTLYRNGEKAGNMSGPLLKFSTVTGQAITIILKGTMPSRKEIL